MFDHERRDGQEFVVDVVLHVDTRAAASADDLARTVDYGSLAQDIHDAVARDPVDLIETLAARIAALCLAREGVRTVEVTVHKPQAPVPVAFSDVSVSIVRSRDDDVPGPRRAAFGLGSNLGDRFASLQAAVDVIAAEPGVRVVGVSPVVETDPVGGPEQDDFLNAVVVVDTSLPPFELLALARRAEQSRGRTREVRWGPRTLDVDVLAVGDVLDDDPELTLPHPRAHERAFVLVPWAAVDPDAVVPGRGRVADLATSLGSAGVRPRADLVLRAGATRGDDANGTAPPSAGRGDR